MSAFRSTKRSLLFLLAAVGMVAALLPAAHADEAVAPRLALTGPTERLTMYSYGKRSTVYLDTGVLLASYDNAFEIWLTRAGWDQQVALTQIIHTDGDDEPVDISDDLFTSWNGFSDFFSYRIEKKGEQVGSTRSLTFCPNAYDMQRVSDEGPSVSGYPQWCFANPFTKGMVWGIAKNWAAPVASYDSARANPKPGKYDVITEISPQYVEAFGIAEEDATFTSKIKVEKSPYDNCHHGCYGSEARRPNGPERAPAGVPVNDDPSDEILPDLQALPAWGMQVANRRNGKSFLNFGATVWVGGASDLVVEGYRRAGEAVMDGWQYFYVDGEPVGKSQVGTLEYDPRTGHNHWHFKQFAEYSLVGDDGGSPGAEIIKSKKEAFCLAPTDAIDLTLPNAVLSPDQIGLGTACGSTGSSWTRETLPLGWGDTYYQGLPGQSFNITTLPNGTYYVKVEANPTGELHEQDDANNVEYREIMLKGPAGNRRVVVPAVGLIDTETVWGY